MRVELNAPPQGGDGVVKLVEAVVDGPEVDVGPGPQRVDLIYRARPVTLAEVGEARPCSPEIVEVAWFAPDALPELQFETAGALVALARRGADTIRTIRGVGYVIARN